MTEKLNRIIDSDFLSEKFAEVFSREVATDEEIPRKKGSQMAKAIRDNSIEDFIMAACGWSIETLLEKTIPRTPHKFYEFLERSSEEEMSEMIYRLVDIKEAIYKLSWYCNRCYNGSNPNDKAMKLFYDRDLSEVVDFNAFTKEILDIINSLCEKEHEKAIKEGYFPEGLDYESLNWDIYGPYRKYQNEVELPSIVYSVLTFLFDAEADGEEEYYEICSYDFSNHYFTFYSRTEADNFMNLYCDCGTLFKVSEGNSEEIMSF